MTDARLRGRRFRQLFHGVHILATAEMTLLLWARAALLASPKDAVISHHTALRIYGFGLGGPEPIHVSTRTRTHARREGIIPHQRRAPIATRMVRGIPVTAPMRTIIDLGTKLTFVELIQAAEFMIHRGYITLDGLGVYAVERHLDGVRRVRRVLGLIREGVESPMETTLRLMIVFARLPEPRCNLTIRDAKGRFVARGDLVYGTYKVLVEYDGWHHERDGRQCRRDLIRRELLEAAGWRVIVVTSEDMRTPEHVVRRVHAALTARGYAGRAPHFSVMWSRWFPTQDDAGVQDFGAYVAA